MSDAIDLRRTAKLVEGAAALERVQIEPHAEVVNLPRLISTQLDVPGVPSTRANPDVIGVGHGGRSGLLLVGDELGLALYEIISLRIGGGDA
jgi:hypothetical protein